MNQQDLWNSKWSKLDSKLSATEYSKRVYKFLKNKNIKSLLDLGSGDGKDSLYFSKKGIQVTSVDFSKEAMNKLTKVIIEKKLENIKTLVADIKNLNLNEKFDAIYANLSLHYFDDKTTTKIFSNLLKLLNPEGYLFVRCKSIEDPLYGIGNEIEKNVFDNKGKIQHLFSKVYLQEKLKDYSIIKIRRTSSKHLTMEKGVVNSHFIEAIAQNGGKK
jgi:cyclopropane fatty-acyl-phospholipid synthase-like methyltransferase